MINQTYPIVPELFETRDRELQSRLPGLYPNEADRQIAEQILVPQLRFAIVKALSDFAFFRKFVASVPPSASEIPNLCAEVDKALAVNRDLLDSEGLGKPLFDYVRSVRESVRTDLESIATALGGE